MEQKKEREKDLYPLVEKFLKAEEPRGFGADYTLQNLGKRIKKSKDSKKMLKVGKVDVGGVKEYKERFTNHFEVIGVEVKPNSNNFTRDLGQTMGYSIFCHRLYYAFVNMRKDLDIIQMLDFASNLGIGIIKINKDSPEDSEILLYSKLFNPDRNTLLRVLDGPFSDKNTPDKRVWLGECIICNGLVGLEELWDGKHWNKKNFIQINSKNKNLKNKISASGTDKHIQFIRVDSQKKDQYFTICKDCRNNFLIRN